MISLEPFSTQKIIQGTTEYNFRTEEDVRRFVYFTLKGNSSESPIITGVRGFRNSPSNPKGIADEMVSIQHLYNKVSGLRIRGLILVITKDELSTGNIIQDIASIAYRFTDYPFLSGFQTAYGVFNKGDFFEIYYAINSVSFVNGTKFRQNHTDILADEQLCAETITADVTGKSIPYTFDFESLEYA